MAEATGDYSKLTVAALKEKLIERGLDSTGKKNELAERLIHSDEKDTLDLDQMEAEVNDEDQNGKEQDEDIAEEDGKEESVLGGEYMSAEDEDVLLGTEDEMVEGTEATEDGDGDDDEEVKEQTNNDGDDAQKEENKEDVKQTEEDDIPEDPEFMERVKRRQKPHDVMKAKFDRIRDIRGRSVLVYPISSADLSEDWLKDILQRSQQFFVRFFEYDCSKCEEGSMELRLKSVAEAKEVAESLKEKRENLKVRHLDPSDVVDKALMEMKGITEDPRLATSKRTLVVEDLSPNVKEDDLWNIFKDATYIFIPRECNGTSKGYGYVDFKTEDDCRAADLQYMEKPAEADGSKLFIRPVWPGDGSHVDGVLSAKDREDLRQKIRALRTQLKNLDAEEEEKKSELGKELTYMQWKLNRDCYLSKLSTKMGTYYKGRRPPQQKRKQPPPQQRQSGNKRPRQSWGSSQPPSLLDMPTRQRQGGHSDGYRGGQRYGGGRGGGYRGGHGGAGDVQPNSQAVQSLLVGLSQMLQGGGGSGGGGGGGSSSGYHSHGGNSAAGSYNSGRYNQRNTYSVDYNDTYYNDHRTGSRGGGGRNQQFGRNRRY